MQTLFTLGHDTETTRGQRGEEALPLCADSRVIHRHLYLGTTCITTWYIPLYIRRYPFFYLSEPVHIRQSAPGIPVFNRGCPFYMFDSLLHSTIVIWPRLNKQFHIHHRQILAY